MIMKVFIVEPLDVIDADGVAALPSLKHQRLFNESRYQAQRISSNQWSPEQVAPDRWRNVALLLIKV